jgi:rhodanese-related sulfurtransferase
MSEKGTDAGLARSVATIVLVGVTLGVGYNKLGLVAPNDWGIAWIGQDRVAAMPDLEALATTAPAQPSSAAPARGSAPVDPQAAEAGDDPTAEIPDIGQPIQVQLAAFKRLYDTGRIVVIDAREPDEFRSGHIAGALNVPYESVLADPAQLLALETYGRPIVTYCGGGTCEVSLSLAEELIFAGHRRVLVYMGGYPEWSEAGFAVAKEEG